MFEKLVLSFMLIFSLCACSLPKKLDKPDFSKEIEIKRSLIPNFKQNNKQIDIYSSFKTHPNPEVRKDFSKYTRVSNIYITSVLATMGVSLYGLSQDDTDLARVGFYGYLSTWIFSPYIRSKLFKSVEKHNQALKVKSVQVIPNLDSAAKDQSINANVSFSF